MAADSAIQTAERPRAGSAPASRFGVSSGRLFLILVLSALIVAVARIFFVQSFVVPSSSMEPELRVGDRVLVSRLDYRVGDVQRGDVIVFNGDGVFDFAPQPQRPAPANAGRWVASVFGMPVGEHDYVKRVIALPGERVMCCDADGRLTVDRRPLTEKYLAPGVAGGTVRFDITVPAGRFWVMGDNRGDSADSRAHLGDPGGGTVPMDHIVGRVLSIWWPWDRGNGLGRITSLPAADLPVRSSLELM